MTKVLIALLVLLALGGTAGPRLRATYDDALYIAKTDGYAQAKAVYAPVTDARVGHFVQAFCEGDLSTMEPYVTDIAAHYGAANAAQFLADSGFVQQSCAAGTVRFLGSFEDGVGYTEYIYILTMPNKTNWYVFTFDANFQIVEVK